MKFRVFQLDFGNTRVRAYLRDHHNNQAYLIRNCVVCTYSFSTTFLTTFPTSEQRPTKIIYHVMNAFVSPAPLPASGLQFSSSVCVCKPAPAQAAKNVRQQISMRGRRDLKKEKQLRNLEFARSHRKRTAKFTNRRAVKEANTNEDNEFLSSVYGTIRFTHDKDNEKEESQS